MPPLKAIVNAGMKRTALARVFAVIFLLCLSASGFAADEMVLEGINGDVTTNEYQSFIRELAVQPPPPSNNIGNVMVYESAGGAKLHGMQTFYAFTHDRRVLDLAVAWSDTFLHGRNDSATGRIVWTGQRELCWPNKETNDTAHALYSGTENGDVIEHICNTARLILENPAVWNETAPADKFGFGTSYLDRAKTYVHECQRSAETTIVPWYVHATKDGYRLIHPDSKVYWKYCESRGPVPWNQQQMITGGLLRLAQCHRLLNDGNTNIAYYEKITGDAADWFFSSCKPVSSKGRVCYNWSYKLPWDPAIEPEDTGHSFYDVCVFRAYQANLGPTRTNMQRLINTARFVMYLDTNRFSGMINGVSDKRRYERKYLNCQWIEMSVLDKEFYEMTAGAVMTSGQYRHDLPVEAAVLYAKHFWATNTSPLPEIAEDATGFPPVSQSPSLAAKIMKRFPSGVTVLLIWIASEFLLSVFKRSGANAVSKDRSTLRLIWLVNTAAFAIGITGSYYFRSARMQWPIVPEIGYGLFFAGFLLRWYSIIYLGRFFTTNVAVARDHRVIDSGPYRFVRHPSYVGALMAVLGICLIFQNWLTLLIIFISACAVQLWRIHIEEKALTEGLGEPYHNYVQRTKRLIPLVY